MASTAAAASTKAAPCRLLLHTAKSTHYPAAHQPYKLPVLQHRPQRRGNMLQCAQPFLANALQGRIGQTGAQLLFGFPSLSSNQGWPPHQARIPIQHRHGIGVGIAAHPDRRAPISLSAVWFRPPGKPRQALHLIGKITQSRQHRYFSLQCHQTSSIGLPSS